MASRLTFMAPVMSSGATFSSRYQSHEQDTSTSSTSGRRSGNFGTRMALVLDRDWHGIPPMMPSKCSPWIRAGRSARSLVRCSPPQNAWYMSRLWAMISHPGITWCPASIQARSHRPADVQSERIFKAAPGLTAVNEAGI